MLKTRFSTLSLLWLKTHKQIEEGTYKGQRFMADKREAERLKARASRKTPDEVRAEIRALARGEELPEAKPEPAAAQPKPQKRAAAPSSAGHAADSNDLIRDYLSHRKQNGEPTSINQAALRAKLEQTREQIKAKYKVRDVVFRVVTEDGRSRVKAVPIK